MDITLVTAVVHWDGQSHPGITGLMEQIQVDGMALLKWL